MTPVLHGYRYSVYTRIARLALIEAGVSHETVEVDPFTDNTTNPHPFDRVPTLVHGDFTLYETAAITRYVDDVWAGGALTPPNPKARARVEQVIGIVDSYVYWPMVRQVFSHRVFRPRENEPADEAEIAAGLAAAERALAALNAVAREGLALSSDPATRADLHLAPMIAYFTLAPEGATALARHDALSEWWSATARRPGMVATDPGL
jgi:glutathione S-transferase